MEYFISNLENSLHLDLPLLSLAGAFILIDAISALNTEEGIATSINFKNWIKQYLPQYLIMDISEQDYYKLRCSLLHQLSGSREDASISTILFLPKASPIQGHMNRLNGALHLDITTFIKDVAKAAKKCISESIHYNTHKDKVITLHENGLSPYIEGTPVIGSKSRTKGK